MQVDLSFSGRNYFRVCKYVVLILLTASISTIH